ncbi:OprD family porin [Pseudomonas fragi]|uniref:OprD family porin n=1 Tax=Pseudomonas fragi TaxID=296 RepID=UPI0010557B0D|nr:OprD family porin [Pseudomonas fragi]
MAKFNTGFTQGPVGFGLEGFAALGLKLDSGGGRTGTSLLPWSDSGHPEDDYSKAGVALAVQASNTVIKYGEQMPQVPVLAYSDVRLLPSSARGLSVNSNEFSHLNIQAGRFTAVTSNDSTNSDGEITTDWEVLPEGRSLSYAGGTYKADNSFTATFYGSEYKDIWHQYYGGASYTLPLNNNKALSFEFNGYDTHDYGASKGGPIDTFAWSVLGAYRFGNHKVSVAYQYVDGDEPFDYIAFDRTQSGIPYLNNVSSVFPFSEPHERSWQLRYDLNFAGYGIPGLTFMTRYIRGQGMDNSHSDNSFYKKIVNYDSNPDDNKHWERDIDLGYVIQSGKAKDLSIRLRNGKHRATTGTRFPDFDEFRIIIEMPIKVL